MKKKRVSVEGSSRAPTYKLQCQGSSTAKYNPNNNDGCIKRWMNSSAYLCSLCNSDIKYIIHYAYAHKTKYDIDGRSSCNNNDPGIR